MIRKLLLGELKKRKAQTITMILMLGLSLTFLLVSVLLIYSSTILIDDFVDMSNIHSVILWKDYDKQDNAKLKQLADDKPYVDNIKSYDVVSVDSTDITLSNGKILPNSVSCFLIAHDIEYNKIYSINESEEIILSPGEIAIPLFIAKSFQLSIDDKLTININDTQFDFIVKSIFKDALFGSEYISTKRLVVEENDLMSILAVCSPNHHSSFIGVNLSDSTQVSTLISDLTEYDISISFNLDRDFLMQVYGASNGIIAMLFLFVAIFIGLISYLIQRYSVHTTIEDEYSHIGLMKATGFQNKQIIAIYLNKYLFIDICGLLVGLLLGTFFSKLFLNDYFQFVVVQSWSKVLSVAFLCVILVGIGYVATSYLYLRRITKLSPIEIKDNRETKYKTPLFTLSLYKKPQINSKIILAINDLARNFKHFTKIIATLLFCFALLISVGNLKSTITSDDFLNYFGLTVGDIYCDIPIDDFRTEKIRNTVDSLNEELKGNNEKAILGADFYVDSRIIDASGVSAPITALKSAASTTDFRYVRGIAPKSEDEIALTNVLAQRYGVEIGDTIMLEVEGVTNEYKVTAINQALYNMGEIILLPDSYQVRSEQVSYRIIAFIESQDKEATIAYLQSNYEYMRGLTASEVVNSLTGNMIDQIVLAINALMVFIFLFVAILLFLFSKMLCFKDSPILRQLNDIGADNSYLFRYQLIKTSSFIIVSILLGVICAISLGRFATVKLFAITGLARFVLIIEPVNSFIVFPFAFLIIALFITAITQGRFIKKHSFKKEN